MSKYWNLRFWGAVYFDLQINSRDSLVMFTTSSISNRAVKHSFLTDTVYNAVSSANIAIVSSTFDIEGGEGVIIWKSNMWWRDAKVSLCRCGSIGLCDEWRVAGSVRVRALSMTSFLVSSISFNLSKTILSYSFRKLIRLMTTQRTHLILCHRPWLLSCLIVLVIKGTNVTVSDRRVHSSDSD